ncbi:MAG: flagellar basal body P-ring formation chaperone FlgA [Planctomycetes bacterium]|jgi:flagella basal body P-ring formation protein FlgA|nr:flagellar basal body P-ring formation chaperone FlgA [Planctomycetota bacterium]
MKLFACIWLCLCAIGGGGDEKDKPRTELRLKAATSVRGLHVTIADLCELPATDGPAAAVGAVRFGPAPVHGYGRTISRTEVVQALAGAGIDVATVQFTGADEVVVQTVSVEIPAGELLDAATAALQAQLAVEGGDVEYEAPRNLRHVQAPPGRQSQDLRARVRGHRTGPNACVVEVEVLVDGEVGKTVPVAFKLQRFQPVLKTLAALRAGQPLGPDTVTQVREPMDQASGLFLTLPTQVDGMVAARNLQPGQRLTLGDIAPPALIHKGDIVTIVLTRGRVKVTAKAMANHDAPLQGRITLTNLQSRSQLSGVVHGPGLVVTQ